MAIISVSRYGLAGVKYRSVQDTFKGVPLEVLLVGGGGAGGFPIAGGGGAGGLVEQSDYYAGSNTFLVTVGAGGAGTNTNALGNPGVDSVLATLTALGGGGGGSPTNLNGAPGGSGGGGIRPAVGGTGTVGQGNDGGDSTPVAPNHGGGGGGAGAAGQANFAVPNPIPNQGYRAGDGGAGLDRTITGSPQFYAGGGGGSEWTGQPSPVARGAGGSGVGGIGGGLEPYPTYLTVYAAGDGVANTGSGGGGAAYTPGPSGPSASFPGGSGGSGVVIIRYATADVSSYTVGAGLTYSEITVGADTVLKFTAGSDYVTLTPG